MPAAFMKKTEKVVEGAAKGKGMMAAVMKKANRSGKRGG